MLRNDTSTVTNPTTYGEPIKYIIQDAVYLNGWVYATLDFSTKCKCCGQDIKPKQITHLKAYVRS